MLSVSSVPSVALVSMRTSALSVLSVALVLLSVASAAAQRAELARARSLYNQRQFDGAIEAATDKLGELFGVMPEPTKEKQ